MRARYWWGNVIESFHLENLGVDGNVVTERIYIYMYSVCVCVSIIIQQDATIYSLFISANMHSSLQI